MICSYCGKEIPKTTGLMYIKSDGSKYYFCSGKCEKHWGRKRKLKYVSKPIK